MSRRPALPPPPDADAVPARPPAAPPGEWRAARLPRAPARAGAWAELLARWQVRPGSPSERALAAAVLLDAPAHPPAVVRAARRRAAGGARRPRRPARAG